MTTNHSKYGTSLTEIRGIYLSVAVIGPLCANTDDVNKGRHIRVNEDEAEEEAHIAKQFFRKAF